MSSGGSNPPGAASGQSGWQKSLAIPMHKATNVAMATRTGRCANHEMKFEGKCHELKGSVYDVVSGKDSFTKMSDQRNL
jgi:hypothetical protein